MFVPPFFCFLIYLFIGSGRNNNNLHYSILILNFINNSDSQIPEFYFHKIRKIYPIFIA